jgi:hypothetical protein
MASGTGFPCHVTVPETFAIVGRPQPTSASRMRTQAATVEAFLA